MRRRYGSLEQLEIFATCMHMRRRYGSLEEISAAVSSCTKCPLCKTRKMSVPGNGSYNAKIMFIGEAPGRSEDLRGRPFAGSAGKKLDDALKSAGLSRDEVYITNVVKCRPPKNRVPEEIERAACQDTCKMRLQH